MLSDNTDELEFIEGSLSILQEHFDRLADESLAQPAKKKPDPWLLMNSADALKLASIIEMNKGVAQLLNEN